MAKVLVVDDEVTVTDHLRETLEFFGHEVTVSNEAADALEAALATPYDLIVLDLSMPRMTGQDFLKKLRGVRHEQTKVVVFSGHLADYNAAYLELLGAESFLEKPATLGEIVDAVSEALGEPPDDLPP